MAERRHPGDRIEVLLEEIRAMAPTPVWERAEALVREILDLYGAGLSRIVEAIAATSNGSSALRDRLVDDALVESLLLLHGLHPHDLETRVVGALERVRPHLGSHGGDVEIAEVDEASGLVRLRMKGSCDGCPSSLLTVKLSVEAAIREAAPEVERIEVEGVTDGGPMRERAADAPPLPFDPAECPAVPAGS